ncbi:hypothetical protein ABIE62_002736 [Porphyrobacter sp. MBR-155]|jgi:hypothetical protein
MLEPNHQKAKLWGCDATHRANNSDTHLTHGCMAHFRQFSRVHRECAGITAIIDRPIAPFFESAPRTLKEAVA